MHRNSFGESRSNMTPSILKRRFQLLASVYEWYDEIAWSFRHWACLPECSACCTSSVILTTLEAAYLWEKNSMPLKDRIRVWVDIESVPPLKMTTNEQASLCLSRQDFEDDTAPLTGNPCPLLEKDRCLCYEARPLMCRMMFSSTPCREMGHAEMPSVLLSLNIASMQFLEHIDKDGASGYLIHVLPYFRDRNLAEAYEAGSWQAGDSKMRPNRANPGFLIPAEHQSQVGMWLDRFRERQNQRR